MGLHPIAFLARMAIGYWNYNQRGVKTLQDGPAMLVALVS